MNAYAHRLLSWRLTYDNAEALKWVALAAMLVDHVNAAFYARELEWATPIGRIAMPVFAFLIGRHLTSPVLLPRLLAIGFATSFVYSLALWDGSLLPLNILLTFACAAGVARLFESGRYGWAVLVFIAGALFCEYSVAGICLVLSSWMWWRRPGFVGGFGLAAAMGMLCLTNGNLWAWLAVPLVWAAGQQGWAVPRVKNLFWWAYPVHLAIIAALLRV